MEPSVKHKLEAEVAGLELIKAADKGFGVGYQNYKYYRYLSCGHFEYLQPTHVRRNNIKCSVCHEERIRIKAKAVGLTLVSKCKTHEFRNFISDTCGHNLTLRVGALEGRAIGSCSICFNEKLSREANEKDLTLITDYETAGIYRRYKFNACGHEQTITHPCVTVGRFQCQTCKEDNFAEDAKKQGLLLIGPAVEKHNTAKRHYQLPCGHTRDFRMSHVRESRWECDICDESHYHKTSNVYLLHMKSGSFEWLKFGYARDIQSRAWCYGLSPEVIYSILATKLFETGKEAIVFEKNIHKVHKEDRLSKKLMQKYMSNGKTECYPMDLLDTLYSYLKEG